MRPSGFSTGAELSTKLGLSAGDARFFFKKKNAYWGTFSQGPKGVGITPIVSPHKRKNIFFVRV